MTKALREDGELAITVRADPANAEKVKAKFGGKFVGEIGQFRAPTL
jgi:hypothetical protein